MHPTPACRSAAILATLLAAATADLPCQDVVLHEVRADANGRWIEVHNRGVNAVDLSGWSLHHATRTPGWPQNYWWPFPFGTTIAAGGYLRVHWYQPVPAVPTPGELYTGDTPWHFSFGLGAEQLSGSGGALALLDSQDNSMMNTASVIRDWVSWGGGGYTREPLAVQAGRWATGRFAPAITEGASLARNTPQIGALASPELEWFVDGSPTPLAANISGAVVASHGEACTPPGHRLFGLPTLRATALPMIGNASFGYAIDNTTGVFGEVAVFVFAAAAAPMSQPALLPAVPGSSCSTAIDAGSVLSSILLPTSPLATQVALPLHGVGPAFLGLELHTQALVLDWLPNAWPPYQGVSNAVRVVLGQ